MMRWLATTILILLAGLPMPTFSLQSPQPTMPSQTLTTAKGNSASWDRTGTYMAVGRGGDGGSKWVEIWKWDGSAISFLSYLPDMDAGATDVLATAWDPEGDFLVAGHYRDGNDVVLSFYSRSGDTFTRLTDPDDPGFAHAADNVKALDWVGDYLAVALDDYTSPYYGLVTYKVDRDASTLTLLERTMSATTPTDVSWDPTGTYVAATLSWGTGDIRWYKRTGDSLSALSNPTEPYAPQSLDWDATGEFILVGQYASGGTSLALYQRSGDTLTKITAPAFAVPDNEVTRVRWHPTGPYAAVGYDVSNDPELTVFQRDGSTLTVFSDSHTQPDDADAYGPVSALGWLPNDGLLVVGHPVQNSGAWLTTYAADGFDPADTGSATLMVPLYVRIGPMGDTVIWIPLYASVGDVRIPGSLQALVPLYVQVGDF